MCNEAIRHDLHGTLAGKDHREDDLNFFLEYLSHYNSIIDHLPKSVLYDHLLGTRWQQWCLYLESAERLRGRGRCRRWLPGWMPGDQHRDEDQGSESETNVVLMKMISDGVVWCRPQRACAPQFLSAFSWSGFWGRTRTGSKVPAPPEVLHPPAVPKRQIFDAVTSSLSFESSSS